MAQIKRDEEWKQFLEGAPKLIEGSSPPQFRAPSEPWKKHTQEIFLHIRSLAESIFIEHGIAAPNSPAGSEGTLVPTGLKSVGLATGIFKLSHLANEATVIAQLETWLPRPWLKTFDDYTVWLHLALTDNSTNDDDKKKIQSIVDAHMMSYKPNTMETKQLFQQALAAIKNGTFDDVEFDDVEEDNDDGEAEFD